MSAAMKSVTGGRGGDGDGDGGTQQGGTGTHFDISQLPSITKGMSAEEETMTRRNTCRFMQEAGRVLQLPRVAISTGMIFFHRFYAKHTFQEHDRFEVAVAALVLAAKTEEAPKELNTVIQECYKLKTRATTSSYLDSKGEDFLKLKEQVLLLERIILHTIGFELSIDHPYKFFADMIKMLISTRQLQYATTSSENNNTTTTGSGSGEGGGAKKTSEIMSKMKNELMLYSMSTANDSYQTSLCLQFGPQEIATACVYLACLFSDVEPVTGTNNWKKTLVAARSSSSSSSTSTNTNNDQDTTIDVEALVSLCVQIIDLIDEKKTSDTESVRKIRKALELLKSHSSSSTTVIDQGQHGPSTATTAATAAGNSGGNSSGSGGNSHRPPPPPSDGSCGGSGLAEPPSSQNKRPRVG